MPKCPCIPLPHVDSRAAAFVIDIRSSLSMSSLIGWVCRLGKDGYGKIALIASTEGVDGHDDMMCFCVSLSLFGLGLF